MEVAATWIIGVYVISGVLGAILLQTGAVKHGIDSPSRGWRIVCRVALYCASNFASCFLTLMLCAPFLDLEGKPAAQSPNMLALVLGPIPLAVLMYVGIARILRARLRYERKHERMLGLRPPLRPASAPEAVRSRSRDFTTLDLDDPQIVRELARRHWEEINHGLASNRDADGASAAQQEFLEEFVSTLEPAQAARVNAVYLEETALHMKEFARVAEIQRDRALDRVERVRRYNRNVLIYGLVMAALAIASLVLGVY